MKFLILFLVFFTIIMIMMKSIIEMKLVAGNVIMLGRVNLVVDFPERCLTGVEIFVKPIRGHSKTTWTR